MGFTVYYRSVRPVEEANANAIRQAANAANVGRTWLSSEPVSLFPGDDNGHLLGGSKPNFQPHPDDVAAAAGEGLPDGTIRDVIDIFCRFSREYGVDWELSHDFDPSIGFIRNGVCDEQATAQIEAFANLGDALGEVDLDEFS